MVRGCHSQPWSQVGQIPIGDATGGAVTHVGGDFNYTARDAWHGAVGKSKKAPASWGVQPVNDSEYGGFKQYLTNTKGGKP